MIAPAAAKKPLQTVLAMFDYDGTWNDPRDPNARQFLDQALVEMKDEFRSQGIDLKFGVVSARDPKGISVLNLPKSMDFTVSQNGSEIQIGGPGVTQNGQWVPTPMVEAWKNKNDSYHFDKTQVKSIMDGLLKEPKYSNLQYLGLAAVCGVPSAESSPYMYTPCFKYDSIKLTPEEQVDANHNGTPDVLEKATYKTPQQMQDFMGDLNKQLKAAGVQSVLSPAYPYMGQPYVMFDATTPSAQKGDAINYLKDMLGIPADHVIVGGDGGNDISMAHDLNGQDDGRRFIAVSGESDLYAAAGELQHAILQPGQMTSSLGIMDGMRRHLKEIAAEINQQ
ncbi:MAG TPA: HAD hydrolase family protein [Candidatus Xenobia bacterium]|jgi:hydroxymethylpyrimidine pyrophosphatase-like HAD family hydrolase